GLHAKRIGTARRICVASPRYLKEHGTPKTPAELRSHHCILYTLLATGTTWPFKGMPAKVAGRVRGNSPEVITTMAVGGMGIAMAPDFLFSDALAKGELRQILRNSPAPDLPIHALYLSRRYVPMRSRLFVEYAARAFAEDDQLRV
ncbi:MAG: substrate binding domain-containing protein, partial [Acetobacteraceae bacterium]